MNDYCHNGLLLRIIVLLLCQVFLNININYKYLNFMIVRKHTFDTVHYNHYLIDSMSQIKMY